jgi:hypothetical protein
VLPHGIELSTITNGVVGLQKSNIFGGHFDGQENDVSVT